MSEVTFDMGGSVDDIMEPELVPVGWVTMEIADDPVLTPNSVKRDAGCEKAADACDVDGAGNNIRLDLTLQMPEIPEFHLRRYTVWLGQPAVGDDTKINPYSHMRKDHEKIDRIADWSSKFSGKTVTGRNAIFGKGMQAKLYMTQRKKRDGSGMENQIDVFAGVRALEE